MFHDIPAAIGARMRELEALDAAHRRSELPRRQRLCQVPPETGRFLAILAAAAPAGGAIEIGTSGGYSALWLATACRARGRRLRTFELLEAKAAVARETFRVAEVEDTVELIVGVAQDRLGVERDIAFCFIDAEKEEYRECYEKVVPSLVPGGILVADNVVSHRAILDPFVEAAAHDRRVDAVVVPIGKGLLVARKS